MLKDKTLSINRSYKIDLSDEICTFYIVKNILFIIDVRFFTNKFY